MGHKNKKTLIRQVQEALDEKLRIGESKHQAKKDGTATSGIFSWKTYKTYLHQCCTFVSWAKKEHGCKTLAECRQYADEWLTRREDASAYTQKLERAALAKLYSCTSQDFVPSSKRSRAAITRSRTASERDRHFSEENNALLTAFCRGTGLRRSELSALRAGCLDERDGALYVAVISGSKGGRAREVPVLDEYREAVETAFRAAEERPDGRVWPSVPVHADIHAYRAEYATKLYRRLARPVEQIPKQDRYCCRRDLKGVVYDKRAMRKVSQALGHNRISVIAGHYLR